MTVLSGRWGCSHDKSEPAVWVSVARNLTEQGESMLVFRRTATTARVLEVEIEAVEAVLPRERDRTVDEDGPVEKKNQQQ